MRRREILKYSGLLAVSSQFSFSVEAQSSESTWPMFQYDAANTGYNPNASIPTEQIGQQWRTSTLGEVVASPVIANGMVFVGSRDGKVYAMDLETGNKQWEYDIGEPIEVSPAIHSGSIYIGSVEGKIYSLSMDGNLDWEFRTDYPEIQSSVITDGNYLYALSAELGDYGWIEGQVYAISPDRGEGIWDFTLISSFSHTPAIDSGTLYTFGKGYDTTGTVMAINTTNGTVEWTGGTTMGIGGITVDGNSVYATTSSVITSFDASDGSIQWEYTYPELEDSWVYSSASVDDRNVYITVNSDNDFGFIYKLDAVTGEKTGRVRLLNEIRSSPVITQDTIYVGTEGGTVDSVNRADLEKGWSVSAGGPVRSTPALVGDSLYVGSNNGYVYSLGRVDETSQTQTSTEAPTETPTETPQPQTTRVTETTTQSSSSTPTEGETMTPTATEDEFERGFFTNGGESSFGVLNNPLVLTVGGFFLSVLGIVYQLVEGD